SLWSELCVFFFQAENGIRYPLVTGVQTCALPILIIPAGPTGMIIRPPSLSCSTSGCGTFSGAQVTMIASNGAASGQPLYPSPAQIGRASCRERVCMSVVEV